MLFLQFDETKNLEWHTAQKLKFSIKDFFSKCDQIRNKLRICSHLLKKSLMESFIFCAVCSVKKLFLEISQNSQENTCARVSF